MADVLITNLTTYLAKYYDGKVHEWGEDTEAALNKICHDDVIAASFGESPSQKVPGLILRKKAERRMEEQKFLSVGTFYYGMGGTEFTIIDDRHLRWKASFKTPKFQADRDYLVEFNTDGQILVIEPYNEGTSIKPKHREYMAKLYDGVSKELLGKEFALFDAMFHKDFHQTNASGKVIRNKDGMKTFVEGLLKLGTKITELQMMPFDEN
ncbi:MAG: hypothetical protein SGARI_007352, partial [Bacillariaceae sp.]